MPNDELTENRLPNDELSENRLPNDELTENRIANDELTENRLPYDDLTDLTGCLMPTVKRLALSIPAVRSINLTLSSSTINNSLEQSTGTILFNNAR